MTPDAVLVDSNVLLDVVTVDPRLSAWSDISQAPPDRTP
jgi:hypothetical protein